MLITHFFFFLICPHELIFTYHNDLNYGKSWILTYILNRTNFIVILKVVFTTVCTLHLLAQIQITLQYFQILIGISSHYEI